MKFLRNIIRFFIIVLAIIGFMSICGKSFMDEKVAPVVHQFNEDFGSKINASGKKFYEFKFSELWQMAKDSATVAMFPKTVENGYEITELKGLMGYDTKIAEDKNSGQKMVTVNTKEKVLLDLTNDNKAEMKVQMLKLAQKHKALPVKVQNVEILETGKWHAMGQELTYAKVKIRDKRTDKDVIAIISNYVDEGENKMIITFAQDDKFSREVAEKFYKK